MDLHETSDASEIYVNGNDAVTLANAEAAAESITESRPRLIKRYVALLTAHPEGLTDHEAALRLSTTNTTCCSMRAALKGRIVTVGARTGPWRVRNTVFALSAPLTLEAH